MARFNPTTITSTYAAISALNANFSRVSDELQKVLYRDGTAPNAMLDDLDMNHFRISNLEDGLDPNDAVTVEQLAEAVSQAGLRGPQGPQGIPGITDLNIGLFTAATGKVIPSTVKRVFTSGFALETLGAAWYVETSGADLATYPHSGFVAADGRKFQIDTINQTVTLYMFGAPGDFATDSALFLNEYFAFANNVGFTSSWVSGYFKIASGINIGTFDNYNLQTRAFKGNRLYLQAIVPIEVMVYVKSMRDISFDFDLWLNGDNASSSTWAGRYANSAIGMYFYDSRGSSWKNLDLRRFYLGGLVTRFSGNNSFMRIESINGFYCGSGHSTSGESMTANWSAKVNSGSDGSAAQKTTITVDTLPPSIMEAYLGVSSDSNAQVRINGYLYQIYSIDAANSKITLYPFLDSTLGLTGTLTYVFGGLLTMQGADCNVWEINLLNCQTSGRALNMKSAYGPVIHRFSAQYCGTAIQVGRQPFANLQGTVIQNAYVEANDEDFVGITRNNIFYTGAIWGNYAFSFAKTFHTGGYRTANVPDDQHFENWSFFRDGIIYRNAGTGFDGDPVYPKLNTNNVFFRDNPVFTLDMFQAVGITNTYVIDLSRLFNYNRGTVDVIGNGASRQPTGTVTFNVPTGGTLNGTLNGTATYSGFTAIPRFVFVCTDRYNNIWKVGRVG